MATLAARLSALATRAGQEIKAVRAELASGLSGKANSSHTHVGTDITSGTIDAARLPPVLAPPYNLGSSLTGTLTVDAANSNRQYGTATGNISPLTINNMASGQMLMLEILASGGTRTIAVTNLSTGLTSPLSIPSGETGFLLLTAAPTQSNALILISFTCST